MGNCGDKCKCSNNNVTFNKVGESVDDVCIVSVVKDYSSITDEPVNSWDEYFFMVCRQVARNSKCLSRRIGAVLVRDKNIVSTGYNGPPRGIPKCDERWKLDRVFSNTYRIGDYSIGTTEDLSNKCPRKVIGFESGEGIDLCPAAHAEENAILASARLGIPTLGSTMYMTCGIPCTKCLVKIINAGIEEIVVTNTEFYDSTSKYLLENSNLKVRIYDFLKT